MKFSKIAQIKNFELYKVPHEDKYLIFLAGGAYEHFYAAEIDSAIARFITIIEEWQGYKFQAKGGQKNDCLPIN
jgi:hypothetical protein